MPGRNSTPLTHLVELKRQRRKFSVLTCYDARTAAIMEAAGVDVLLVGDTAAEVVLGLDTTRDIPAEVLLALTAAVRRGAPRAFVMADLPHACRSGSTAETVEWARRFWRETGSNAVKVEFKPDEAGLLEAMAAAGIPVVAHLGLLPQHINSAAGYRAQGRDAAGARVLIEAARRMERAGPVMLLLEAVAAEVAREITEHTSLPVVGCVAGPYCDGTVVVLHDMIGWGGGHPPRAVKQYENLSGVLERAFAAYATDVREGHFPTMIDSIHMKPGEYDKLMARTEGA